MKIIDCSENVKKKNELTVIYKELEKIKNKMLRHPVYLNDSLTTNEFIKENNDETVYLKNFLHDMEILLTGAFVKANILRISISLTYRYKKKSKLVKIVRDFIKEAEVLFGYLDKMNVKSSVGRYYIDLYKDVQRELFEIEQDNYS